MVSGCKAYEKTVEKNTGKKLDVMYGWSLSVKKSRQAGFIFRSYFFSIFSPPNFNRVFVMHSLFVYYGNKVF